MDLQLYVQVPQIWMKTTILAGTLAMLVFFTLTVLYAKLYATRNRVHTIGKERDLHRSGLELAQTEIEKSNRIIQEVSAALHDRIGNNIAFICTMLKDQMEGHRNGGPFNPSDIDRCRALADSVLQNYRNLHQLIDGREILKRGLINAMEAQVRYYEELGLQLDTEFGRDVENALDHNTSQYVLRATQELLSNAFRHARPKRIWVWSCYL